MDERERAKINSYGTTEKVKGKKPRPTAKVPKCVLSGKGCETSETTRMLA